MKTLLRDLGSLRFGHLKLAERPDLDTICAYDYGRMKNYALSGEGLKMQDWHPTLRGVDKIPKMLIK